MTNAAKAEVQTSLRGVVEIVFYSGATFSAGKLRTADGKLDTFAGKVYVREGESVVLEGHWAKHPKYGLQFTAEASATTWIWTPMAWPTSSRTILT